MSFLTSVNDPNRATGGSARSLLCLVWMLVITMNISTTVSDHFAFGQVTKEEFLGMYQSSTIWYPEMKQIRNAFKHKDHKLSRDEYSKLLSTCLLDAYGFEDPGSQEDQAFAESIRIHVKEYVFKVEGKETFTL